MVLGRLTILDDACMRSQPAPALRDTDALYPESTRSAYRVSPSPQ